MPPKLLNPLKINARFRGMLPMVIDIETSGLNSAKHAILEIAMVPITLNTQGKFFPEKIHAYHVEPFPGAEFDKESLNLTQIDPMQPLRFAIPERQVLHNLFQQTNLLLKKFECQRAILVGHNSWFDLAFLQAARKRCHFKKMPFHSFTSLDTATLSALVLGETVLARALRAAKIPFNLNQAHSAIYDAKKTAELFCYILNQYSVI